MTADKSHPTDQGTEKHSVKLGDKPPAGMPITEKADNTIQQRFQEREALKVYRFTRDPNNSFSIDMGDGSEVKDKRPLTGIPAGLAGGGSEMGVSESKQELIAFKTPESTPPEKSITGAELIKIAEKLGHDPHRWEPTENSPSPKCNQYVEAVLKAGHIPFPWKAGFADCHAMREALDKECQRPGSKWEKVYVYDERHGQQSDDRFTHYKPKTGGG
jgi:hypothetical protein